MNHTTTDLTSSKFILILRKASEKSIDMNCGILKAAYDRFVKLVLAKGAMPCNWADYRMALVDTCVELSSLTGALKKKRNGQCLAWKSH